MDDIDALLLLRVAKPAGIVANEVPVWNGSAWARGALGSLTTGLTVSAANTDLAFGGGTAPAWTAIVNTGGGTLRSLAAGSFAGQLVTIKSHFGAAAGFTIKGSLAGGTGAQFRNGSGGALDIVLGIGDSATFAWDSVSSLWWEVSRDQATSAAARIITGQITGATGAIAAGTGFSCVRNSVGNWTITFTVAFPAAPVVTAIIVNNAPYVFSLNAVAVGSFTIQSTHSNTNALTDNNFQFLATAMA